MAEGILRARWATLCRTDLAVSSMGIHGLDRQCAASFAQQVCMENGIDISQHASRQLNFDEINASDLIFALEMIHKDFILMFFPHLVDRVFLLGSWPKNDSAKGNIKDPMGGNAKAFRRAFETIALHIDRIIPDLQNLFT
jgi:protein-tyrosine-phosphatase